MAQTISDTAAIERDLNATRARLDTRLSELAQRLSPGQVLDETLATLRTREGTEFARNLGQAVREKPIPAALVGIGLAWLLLGPREHAVRTIRYRSFYDGPRGQPPSAEPDLMTRAWTAGREVARRTDESDADYRARVTEARGKVLGVVRGTQETAEAYADRVQEALYAARDRVSEAASGAANRVKEMASNAGEGLGQMGQRLSEMGQSASETAQDMADRVRERAHDLRDRASGLGARATEQARAWTGDGGARPLGGVAAAIAENPALLGVIGLATGALLGALLPVTEFEREHLGGAARELRSGIRETVRTATDRGAEVARTAMDAGRQTVQEVAKHASEVGSQASEAAKDVADRAKQHAEDMRAGAAETARSVAAKAEGQERTEGRTAT
jgi:cell division septum initiation protein DivIVA